MTEHSRHSLNSQQMAAARAATGPHPYGVVLCACGNPEHTRPYTPDLSDRSYPTPTGDDEGNSR